MKNEAKSKQSEVDNILAENDAKRRKIEYLKKQYESAQLAFEKKKQSDM